MTAATRESSATAPGAAEPVLEVEGLSAGYGRLTVLHDVSLALRQGEIVSLLGPNGAGKSTLLLSISGLVRISAGDVRVAGRSVLRSAPHVIARSGVAHIPEDRSLFTSLTVDEHLRLSAKPGGMDVYTLFPELARMKNKRAGVMSGGEQQMLTLARALVAAPRVLLVDEMSLGLAPVVVERLFAALGEISRSQGIAILLVEQHVPLALKYTQRGYVLSGGRIAAEGTAAELLERWSDVESSYLGKTAG